MKVTFKSNGNGGWTMSAEEAEELKKKFVSSETWERYNKIIRMFSKLGYSLSIFEVLEYCGFVVYVPYKGDVIRAVVIQEENKAIKIISETKASDTSDRLYIEDGDVLYTEKSDYITVKTETDTEESFTETKSSLSQLGTIFADLVNQAKEATETLSEKVSEIIENCSSSDSKESGTEEKNSGCDEESLEDAITHLFQRIKKVIKPEENDLNSTEEPVESTFGRAIRRMKIDLLKKQIFEKKEELREVNYKLATLNDKSDDLNSEILRLQERLEELERK